MSGTGYGDSSMSRTGHGPAALAATELGHGGVDVAAARRDELPAAPSRRPPADRSPAPSAIAMGVADRTWVLPRGAALWVPAGVSHSVEAIGAAEMITLWFDPSAARCVGTEPTVVDADDLLLAARRPPARRVAHDRRANPVRAGPVRRAPAGRRSTGSTSRCRPTTGPAGWPRRCCSTRATTAAWSAWGRAGRRQRPHAHAGVPGRRPASGSRSGAPGRGWPPPCACCSPTRPMSAIAPAVGYATTSAFDAAFRRTMGAPPSAFRAGLTSPAVRRGRAPKGRASAQ